MSMFAPSCPICWERNCNCNDASYELKGRVTRLEEENKRLKQLLEELKR